jgi:tetratricopeptide (TPR) repeat protein
MLWLALLLGFAGAANAQIIDRIDVVPASDGRAEILIRFTVNVVYQRSSSVGRSREIRLYFNISGAGTTPQPRDRELRQSDPTALVPHFSVSYPEADSSLLMTFDQPTGHEAKQGPDARSISILVPALAGAPSAVVTPAPGVQAPTPPPEPPRQAFEPVPLARVEEVAAELLARGRTALAAGDLPGAINSFNYILDLPANKQSAAAQELIGQARERTGEMAKAKAEYDLYLRLYPNGEGAERVRARLVVLAPILAAAAANAATAAAAASTVQSRRAEATPWQVTGGISQSMYRGNSHTVTTTAAPAGFDPLPPQVLNAVDQHQLITNLDFNARRRSETGVDHRFVFRDSYSANFLAGQKDNERLSVAYYEISDRTAGYQGRIGRQSGSFAVVGQFDGIYAGYQVKPDVRINAAAGVPVQYAPSTSPLTQFFNLIGKTNDQSPLTPQPYNRNFFAANIEYQAKPEQIGGNVYFVQQNAEANTDRLFQGRINDALGYVDRRAVGAEIRYFDARKSGFVLLDYDVMMRSLNVITLQGNMQVGTGGNIYALIDHRKAPMLALTNVLQAATATPTVDNPSPPVPTKISEALLNTGKSLSDLRNWARDLAAESNLMSAGFTYPLTPRWQIGGDMNWSRMTSTIGVFRDDGSVAVAPQPGTLPSKSFSGQLIGNSIFFPNDSAVANLSLAYSDQSSTSSSTARNLSLNHVSTWFSKLRVDVALRFFWQVQLERLTDVRATQTRFSPTLRFNYRWLNNLSFDAEMGMEKAKQEDGNGGTTTSDRQYIYLGYRWDFQ